jgi:polar amino acid transport system permease protein
MPYPTPEQRRLTRLDVLWLLLLAAGGAWLVHRLGQSFHYRWHWAVIPQYLVRFDAASGHWVPNLLLEGLIATVRLSLWGTLFATLVGTAFGLCRISRRPFRRLLGRSYVGLMRNLPPLVLIFIGYYFVGDQLLQALGVESWLRASPFLQRLVTLLFGPPGQVVPFLSALLTLAAFEGAYVAEIVRGGIEGIAAGQWQGAAALGLTRWQQLRHVVLPQALPRLLPQLAGQFISTIKDSAIVSVISVPELTFQGMQLMTSTYLTLEIWITITVLYLLLTLSCSLLLARFETVMRRRYGS